MMKKTSLFIGLIMFLLYVGVAFAQCPLIIQYDAAGNRIFRGNECDPECSTFVSNNNDAGIGSLRNAISCARDGDLIEFDASLHNLPIQLLSGKLLVNVSVDINPINGGLLTKNIIIRSSSNDKVLEVSNVRIEEIMKSLLDSGAKFSSNT